MRIKKDGIKILPKVGFHLWQNHFLRWNSRRLRGLEDSAKDLRGCKGGLPVLAEKPNKAFFGQRWAFPCLTGFEASRRLNLSLYGAKVGFFLSDCLKRLIRWASSLRRWAFPEVRPKVGFERSYLWPKVGFSPLVGFHASRTAKGGLFLSDCLRGCKGRLPGLAEKPNKDFFGQRWAFPCLTVFRTARRLNLSLYGAKVGFHASKDPEYCQDCQRWASMVPKVGFEASKVGLFPVLPKVGFEGGLFGLIWLILAFSLESYLLYILYTL